MASANFCPQCGAPLRNAQDRSSIFCEYCGAEIQLNNEVVADTSTPETTYEHKDIPHSTVRPRPANIPNHTSRKTVGRQKREAQKKWEYWAPVGYRTKSLGKMALATLIYISFFSMLVHEDTVFSFPHRFAVVFAYLGAIYTFFEWRPLTDYLPGFNKENKTGFLVRAGWAFAFFCIFVSLSVLIPR